eukprot:2254807-Pleurochrysis_carterae.AAC.1
MSFNRRSRSVACSYRSCTRRVGGASSFDTCTCSQRDAGKLGKQARTASTKQPLPRRRNYWDCQVQCRCAYYLLTETSSAQFCVQKRAMAKEAIRGHAGLQPTIWLSVGRVDTHGLCIKANGS